MTPRKLIPYVAAAGAALLSAACKGDRDVQIVEDAPVEVSAGSPYRHTLRPTRALKGGAFLHCSGSRDNRVTIAPEGAVSFTASDPGEVKLCAAYRNADGATLDEYSVTVRVGPRAKAKDEDFPEPVAAFRRSLAKAIAATDAEPNAKLTPCPVDMGKASASAAQVHAYDRDWLASKLKDDSTREAQPVFFTPPHRLARHLSEPEHDPAQAKELVERTYAVIVRAHHVETPKLNERSNFLKPRTYDGGAYEGIAFVVELAGGSVVCRRPLVFRSSKEVSWLSPRDPSGDPTDEKAQAELDVDFSRSGRKALVEVLRRDAHLELL